MKNRITAALIRSTVALSALLMLSQSASAFILDSFDMSQSVGIVAGTIGAHAVGEAPVIPPADPFVVGGYRDIDVNLTRLNTGYETGDILAATTGGGSLGYTETAGVAGGQMWVTWDGGQDNPGNSQVNSVGLGSQDFTVGGTQNLLAVGLYTQVGGNDLYLTVWDTVGIGHSKTVHQTVPGVFADQIIKFNYSDFTGVDMTKVGAVQLHWATNPLGYGATANFDFIETDTNEVPEPGTMALMAALIGLGGLGVVIRRRVNGVK